MQLCESHQFPAVTHVVRAPCQQGQGRVWTHKPRPVPALSCAQTPPIVRKFLNLHRAVVQTGLREGVSARICPHCQENQPRFHGPQRPQQGQIIINGVSPYHLFWPLFRYEISKPISR